jgi:hypothetical protein
MSRITPVDGTEEDTEDHLQECSQCRKNHGLEDSQSEDYSTLKMIKLKLRTKLTAISLIGI